MEDHIFALDIGTRSVTGIILKKQDDKFEVLDFYTKEHKERSMRDGQIHNVVAVSDIITDVKETLEKEHGTLQKVCVAAAGRALKTTQATATILLNQQPITDDEPIKHLELSAVQSAQLKLATQEKNNDYTNYYCVGYSVLHYTIDQEQIASLIDQSGEEASVEIIATFLPKVVVESLLAALGRAGLEMEALTLEPIAAIHVLIPESMRRLNVSLVDIGAGTSDIAITDKGTVVAYGMVPIAGDEITEAISDHYLLDFPMAEQTKRNIVNNGKDIVEDILGFETTITYDALVDKISSKVENLAKAIADEIIQLNSKSPKAIMLVGGGSMTPEITAALSSKLQLPANRVAVRGIDAIQNLINTEKLPSGPDFVTPIGIAIAAKQNPVHYVSVKVNGKVIRMFEMKQLTVGDCLVQAGIDINKMYGKPGIASIITVNGKNITLPGEFGNPPTIHLNNDQTTVDSQVQNGDEITIEKGRNGEEANVTIDELIGEIPSTTIYFNDKPIELKVRYYVNEQLQTKDYKIQDKDTIVWRQVKSVQDFLTYVSTEKLKKVKSFTIYVNNQKINLDEGETQIYVNNKKVSTSRILKQDDHLVITSAKAPTVNDLLNQMNKTFWEMITIRFNDEVVHLKQQHLSIKRDRVELNEESELRLNDRIEVQDRGSDPFIFQDVFRYVDIDLTNANGNFRLYKNKQPTTFDASLKNGDQLSLKWE